MYSGMTDVPNEPLAPQGESAWFHACVLSIVVVPKHL
jgi:hypothetical protein